LVTPARVIADSPVTSLEEILVANHTPETLSAVEREVVAQIRAWRASPGNELQAILLKSPARLMHHFIVGSHGHVKLRIRPIATELGVAMRTLERTFVNEHGKTMLQCQVETRVAFSQDLLSIMPPTKISAIANMLGYDEVRDFNRFFEKHMHETPSAWGRRERERTRCIERAASRNRETF
jgi:AraC-like DNA-binding protein